MGTPQNTFKSQKLAKKKKIRKNWIRLVNSLGKFRLGLKNPIFPDFADFMFFLTDFWLLKVFRGLPNAF